jgi:hypothetical protein
MEMEIYKNADDFLEKNRYVMEQYSVEANLIWANAMSHKTAEDGFRGISITQGSSIYLAIQTISHPMVHFSTGNNIKEMAKLLVKYLSGINAMPQKISGIRETIDLFKDAAHELNSKYKESQHLNLMICEKVNDIHIIEGKYQSPITADFDFSDWFIGFWHDCEIENSGKEAARDAAKQMIKNGKLVCFSVDGQPVTMAAKKRKLIGGRCVGEVYTPEKFRSKGYSTACLKHLTQEILSEGNDCAFLFANKYNPASNRVYEKVGYKKIADFMEYTKK